MNLSVKIIAPKEFVLCFDKTQLEAFGYLLNEMIEEGTDDDIHLFLMQETAIFVQKKYEKTKKTVTLKLSRSKAALLYWYCNQFEFKQPYNFNLACEVVKQLHKQIIGNKND